MNNFTFGNARHQYYETIAGGSGAGPVSTERRWCRRT
jgi:N-methylhydantoinase B/oxoprolinase/acetone carboxylase alpha subunit